MTDDEKRIAEALAQEMAYVEKKNLDLTMRVMQLSERVRIVEDHRRELIERIVEQTDMVKKGLLKTVNDILRSGNDPDKTKVVAVIGVDMVNMLDKLEELEQRRK